MEFPNLVWSWLSKYSHFILIKHPYTARNIAEIFVKEIVCLHGIPKSILSDCDPLFMIKFWQEIFHMQGTKLHMSSSYHPESDGQTEVLNRCLETYLRCFAIEQPRHWSLWIPWAEFWYNTNFHASLGTTPFEAVYGRKPPNVVQHIPSEVQLEVVARELRDRDEALRQLKLHLSKSQEQMKHAANIHRREVMFQVGDWVYLKLCPHKQHSVVQRINQKDAPRYYGPFQVEESIGPMACRLKLPATSKIHPVFHVSLLKHAVMTQTINTILPEELTVAEPEFFLPHKVLEQRSLRQHGKLVKQLLIQWQNKTVEEATWEEEVAFKTKFPAFSLEDKIALDEGGSDKEGPKAGERDETLVQPIWRVNSKRRGTRAERREGTTGQGGP